MRTILKVSAVAVAVLLVAVSSAFWQKYQKTAATLAEVRALNDETRGRYSEALNSINTIQDSLNAIVLGEGAPAMGSSSYDTEANLTRTQGDVVMDRIAVLKAGLERTRARIEELDANLHKNGVKIEGLEKLVASLRRSASEKEARIALLVARVDTLQTEVTGLTATVETQQQEVAARQRELGTVYAMIGSKKDLTAAGAAVSTGGVLGLGKTLKATGQVDESQCIAINTDQESTLDIAAPKAAVLTPQPATSYTLESAGERTVLRILDPVEFRKVRHLVIVKLTS